MNQQDIQERVNIALFACIVSLIPMYFKVAKVLLFILAMVFAFVVVGLMVSAKVFIAALLFINTLSQKNKKAEALA